MVLVYINDLKTKTRKFTKIKNLYGVGSGVGSGVGYFEKYQRVC